MKVSCVKPKGSYNWTGFLSYYFFLANARNTGIQPVEVLKFKIPFFNLQQYQHSVISKIKELICIRVFCIGNTTSTNKFSKPTGSENQKFLWRNITSDFRNKGTRV